MKRWLVPLLALAVAQRTWAQDAPALPAESAPVRASAVRPSHRVLQPGVPEELFVAPGRATTVLLHSGRKVASISLASPIVTYRYDKALNQLEVTAAGRTAGSETNLNLRIGARVYVLLVRIVNDVRAQALCELFVDDESIPDDEDELDRARALPPREVDIVGAARVLERALADPVFLASRPDLRIRPLRACYAWNGCVVVLEDLAEFLDRDLLLFRVRWANRTSDALYLDSRQYGLFAGNARIPILARYTIRPDPVVYPGQADTAYLAVQGYRLSRRNDWRLGLPPDAAALGRLAPAMNPFLREKKDGRRAPGYLVYLACGLAALGAVAVLHRRSAAPVQARARPGPRGLAHIAPITGPASAMAPVRLPEPPPPSAARSYRLAPAERPAAPPAAPAVPASFDPIHAALEPPPAPPGDAGAPPAPAFAPLPPSLPPEDPAPKAGSPAKKALPKGVDYEDPAAAADPPPPAASRSAPPPTGRPSSSPGERRSRCTS